MTAGLGVLELSLVDNMKYNFDDSELQDSISDEFFSQEKLTKPKERISRSKKNKRKVSKEKKYQEGLLKVEKKKIASINSIKAIIKEITLEEYHKSVSSKLLNKQDKPECGTVDVRSIALTEEISGSLRSLRTNGSIVHSIVSNMVQTRKINTKDMRTRKMHEKPHAGKMIKWFAKYKY